VANTALCGAPSACNAALKRSWLSSSVSVAITARKDCAGANIWLQLFQYRISQIEQPHIARCQLEEGPKYA
jgi:hypothetical protein